MVDRGTRAGKREKAKFETRTSIVCLFSKYSAVFTEKDISDIVRRFACLRFT